MVPALRLIATGLTFGVAWRTEPGALWAWHVAALAAAVLAVGVAIDCAAARQHRRLILVRRQRAEWKATARAWRHRWEQTRPAVCRRPGPHDPTLTEPTVEAHR